MLLRLFSGDVELKLDAAALSFSDSSPLSNGVISIPVLMESLFRLIVPIG